MKFDQLRHWSGLSEITACELWRNQTPHMIPPCRKVALEQSPQSEESLPRGGSRLRVHLCWAQTWLGIPDMVPFHCVTSGMFLYLMECPSLYVGIPLFPGMLWRIQWGKDDMCVALEQPQVPCACLPDIGDLGRCTGCGMEELLCQLSLLPPW